MKDLKNLTSYLLLISLLVSQLSTIDLKSLLPLVIVLVVYDKN